MAMYVCLVFLVLAVMILAGRRTPTNFGIGVAFAALAAIVMIASAIRSLWLYPL